MALTLLESAILKKMEEKQEENASDSNNNSLFELNKKILLILVSKKCYFTKAELIQYTNCSEKLLEKSLNQLKKIGLVESEGWLVRGKNPEEIFVQNIAQTLIKNIKK